MGAPVDGSEEEVTDTGGCWCVAVGWVRPLAAARESPRGVCSRGDHGQVLVAAV